MPWGKTMNKAFVKETNDDALPLMPEMPVGVRNYITPDGYRKLQQERKELLDVMRPAALQSVSGDDNIVAVQENSLREIDQRIHYLQTRIESAEIVDASVHDDSDRIFFGATVDYADAGGEQHEVSIVGLDELDPAHGRISWLSPLAQVLLGASVDDVVTLESPAGTEELQVLAVRYPRSC